MGRKRNPKRDEAFELWKASGGKMSLADIARQLGLPASRIRKWKVEDEWERKLSEPLLFTAPISEKERSKKRGAPKGNQNAKGNRGGAPKGNQNAKGHGAPKRNKNALKTGMYETIFLDALDEDEQELFGRIDTSPLAQAEEQLILLSIQERRHLNRIKALKEGLSENERKVIEELTERKDKEPYTDPKTGKTIMIPVTTSGMQVTEVQTIHIPKLDKILKQEEALIKTRDKKIKVINLIASLQQEKEKMELAKERLELEKYKVYGPDGPDGAGDDEDYGDDEW